MRQVNKQTLGVLLSRHPAPGLWDSFEQICQQFAGSMKLYHTGKILATVGACGNLNSPDSEAENGGLRLVRTGCKDTERIQGAFCTVHREYERRTWLQQVPG